MSNNTIMMNLDTEEEHKVFDRILLGLVMKGVTFEIKVEVKDRGNRAAIYLTGGY